MQIPSSCPVRIDFLENVSNYSVDLAKAIRKLNQDLSACKTCTADIDLCPVLLRFQSQVVSAIDEVLAQANLISNLAI